MDSIVAGNPEIRTLIDLSGEDMTLEEPQKPVRKPGIDNELFE
jgi:hypothetical protein